MKLILRIILLLLLFIRTTSGAQNTNDVFVDKNGVMRWGNTKEEVHGFGVNYTAMFAHAYRTAMQLKIPIEQAIDNDVYHFARLGFDAYRVHVWDTEISDTLGNLLNNEHLRLFDYTLMKMKERGMKFIITPIAYWGNGWPEPDEQTPGFSAKYGKDACLTNPAAIKAQENYLFQFLNHKNSYTNLPYKSDPDIIAFEISNEPHHGEEAAEVTSFITKMVKSMRKTGCKKPIFYNVSHSIHLVDAYYKAGIQGGTFQWYPTRLGFGHELQGNFLTSVDSYSIPFADHSKFKSNAKIVYEFDAADIGRSYIYPAMARSFRTAGIQVATHFSYDPTYMADVNTEYGTHYMNLAYTPQKALSLMIAAEVFHHVPMNKNYGGYPANSTFDDFSVDYAHDLAQYNSDSKFFYTNHTSTLPKSLQSLKQIAGSGTSEVVAYEGTGAYFLDKLEPGVWRLEVMPDAIWIIDPFERTSPNKEIAKINWRNWSMSVNLPDLGDGFKIKGVNDGNQTEILATKKSFMISPGTYLLSRNGVSSTSKPTDQIRNLILKEFSAPATTLSQTYVLHKPLQVITSGTLTTIQADVISVAQPDLVELHVRAQGYRSRIIRMENIKGYQFQAIIPEELANDGYLQYHIVVTKEGRSTTYPSENKTHPNDWDFYDGNPYVVKVVDRTSPMYLFNALTDTDYVMIPWNRNTKLIPSSEPGKAELQINCDKLYTKNPENINEEPIYDFSFRFFIGDKISGRQNDFISSSKIVLNARSLNDKPCKLQIAFAMKDGTTYGGVVEVTPEKKDYSLMINDLKKVKLVILPRPYPTFLPYFFEDSSTQEIDLSKVESIQFSIGPGISVSQLDDKHGVAIESVRVEQSF